MPGGVFQKLLIYSNFLEELSLGPDKEKTYSDLQFSEIKF